jgi:hypothetical protein
MDKFNQLLPFVTERIALLDDIQGMSNDKSGNRILKIEKSNGAVGCSFS